MYEYCLIWFLCFLSIIFDKSSIVFTRFFNVSIEFIISRRWCKIFLIVISRLFNMHFLIKNFEKVSRFRIIIIRKLSWKISKILFLGSNTHISITWIALWWKPRNQCNIIFCSDYAKDEEKQILAASRKLLQFLLT